jgi:putative ABC transport system permease protein
MLQNYLKIAIRSLWKNKAFTAINIAGLAIGIATCLTIMLFVQNELSYDRFNTKADQIVRVVFRAKFNGEEIKEAVVMPPAAQSIKNDYPEVLAATRLRRYGTPKIEVNNKIFKEATLAYTDANLFDLFTLPFVKGNPKTALTEPNSVVITQALAYKYFGKQDPIGQTLNFKDSRQLYKITGILADLPVHSHFHFDIFGSMESLPEAKEQTWMTSNFYTYLLLPQGYDYKKLEAKLPQVVDKYMGPQIKQALGVGLDEFRQKGNDVGLFLQPLLDIHLKSDFSADSTLEPGGDIRYVYIFGAIALFMLLIACINFMNLSTAGASKRAKEVGIRKVLGSVKSELVSQFLFESLILTFVALALSVVLVKITLPVFNDLSGKTLDFNVINSPLTLLALLLFGLLVSVLAGSYPAFFLSSFKPISVLKSRFINSKGISLRSTLVVFQFVVSISLILGITVVYQQLAYIQNKKLGYDKSQLLVLRNAYLLGKGEAILKTQLEKDPRVMSVTASAFLPAGPTDTNMSGVYPDNKKEQNRRSIIYQIDENYLPTMGMELVLGRNFSKAFTSDSSKVIINETMAKNLGWGKNALGHRLNRFIDNNGNSVSYTVLGVVKDFHFRSLHEEIAPMMMVLEESHGLIVKVKTQDISGLLANIKAQRDKQNSGEAFSYAFVDELFNKTYISEQKTGKILSIFAALTIFIACLGLFGLATFTAEQRTKEIGIRKVLGATVGSVVVLLSKDFLKLVLIACVVAFPIDYYAMNKWLADFAYRIDISWWVFLLAGLLSALIALLTVGYQAIVSALMNPVESLKTE